MKVHSKKKEFRSALRKMTKEGKINLATGLMVPRNQAQDNSMKRDFSPQEGKKGKGG